MDLRSLAWTKQLLISSGRVASWVTGIAHDSCFLSYVEHSIQILFAFFFRRRLVALDLRDLKKRKVALGRAAFKLRVQSVCRSQEAQRVAASCALGLKKVCQEVVRLDGDMARS